MTNQLSKQDWIEHGLAQLAKQGADVIKAELLAKSLGVSRGSFYWHFKNISDYRRALLNHWRRATTLDTIRSIDQTTPANQRFERLLITAFQDNNPIERAVRGWALREPMVAKVVNGVDAERLDYLESTLRSSGVQARHAKVRAQLSYWAYLGRLMLLEESHRKMSTASTKAIASWIVNAS